MATARIRWDPIGISHCDSNDIDVFSSGDDLPCVLMLRRAYRLKTAPGGADALNVGLIDGRILYTNLGGHERALPRGMAISFRPLCDPIQQVIRADISATQRQLEV